MKFGLGVSQYHAATCISPLLTHLYSYFVTDETCTTENFYYEMVKYTCRIKFAEFRMKERTTDGYDIVSMLTEMKNHQNCTLDALKFSFWRSVCDSHILTSGLYNVSHFNILNILTLSKSMHPSTNTNNKPLKGPLFGTAYK